jgi:uncharacterized protein (UPF0333 family)
MNPNLPGTPLEPQPTITIAPIAQPSLGAVPITKKHNMALKVSLSALVVLLAAGGVVLYLWRDAQMSRQKTDDALKVSQLDASTAAATKQIADSQKSSGSSKADTVRAQTNAMSVSKIAEVVNANGDHYPILTSDFLTPNAVLPKGITVTAGALNVNNGLLTVRWEYSGKATAPTGGRVTYWDFTTTAVATEVIYVGDATASSTFVTPKS